MSTQLHRHTQIVRSPKDTASTGQHANINTNTHYAITSSSANPDILRHTWLIQGPDTHARVLVTHSFNMYLLSYYYVLAIRKQYRTCLKHKHMILHTWAYCLADDKIESGPNYPSFCSASFSLVPSETHPRKPLSFPFVPGRAPLRPPGSAQYGRGAPRPPGTPRTAASHRPRRRSRPSPRARGRRRPRLSPSGTPAWDARCSPPRWPAASWAGSSLDGKAPCRVGRSGAPRGPGWWSPGSGWGRLGRSCGHNQWWPVLWGSLGRRGSWPHLPGWSRKQLRPWCCCCLWPL